MWPQFSLHLLSAYVSLFVNQTKNVVYWIGVLGYPCNAFMLQWLLVIGMCTIRRHFIYFAFISTSITVQTAQQCSTVLVVASYSAAR